MIKAVSARKICFSLSDITFGYYAGDASPVSLIVIYIGVVRLLIRGARMAMRVTVSTPQIEA